ncbi:MAG: hypothetical protein QM805_19285 [Pseudomonas sp.]
MQKNALFYPQIGLQNSSLTKAMALYYDKIYRIVPDNVIPDDAEDLQALLEEGSIGKTIDPAKYSKKASKDFLSKIEEWSAAALEFGEDDELTIARLHTEKNGRKSQRAIQGCWIQRRKQLDVRTNSNRIKFYALHGQRNIHQK